MKRRTGVIILSGGLDSTVLLHDLLNEGVKLFAAISYHYGQRHNIELHYAHYWTRKFKIPHYIIKLNIPLKSALIDHGQIPKQDYSVETQKITVVPSRNAIMLSIAAGICESLGSRNVFYAAHHSDYAVYPDCRPKFIKLISEAIQAGTYKGIKVEAPFKFYTKTDIVKRAVSLGIDIEELCTHTWSCYDPQRSFFRWVHCGVCGTCRERRRAFIQAGVNDYTIYKEVENEGE